MNSTNLSHHLRQDHYGDFWLTEAVRPSPKRQIIPSQGYRKETYTDARQQVKVPVLAAAVSREHLFEAFLELLEPMGETVDVILETSHESMDSQHRDLHREHIDSPVLQSHLCDFEDLLTNDGCTGIAVVSTVQPIEVQFDEHKLLIVYAENLKQFEQILQGYDVREDKQIKFITEGEHLHNTNRDYFEQFEQLCFRLGVGEMAEHVNW